MTRPSAIVVGAGINGLCLAHELLKEGWLVSICDQGDIPCRSSASYGRHRLIHPWRSKQSTHRRNAAEALRDWHSLLEEIDFDGFVRLGVVVANTTVSDSQHSSSCDPNTVSISYSDAEKIMPQLRGGSFHDLTLYPDFGCLLADQILENLSHNLERRGATFFPHSKITKIDPEKAIITTDHGHTIIGDLVFVAAGYGTDPLIRPLGFPLLDSKRRCYVLYLKMAAVDGNLLGTHCWASLGASDDLWGMPPVRGIPAKLGCGDLTEIAIDGVEPNEAEIRQRFKNSYQARFPAFNQVFEHSFVRYNYWTMFDRQAQVSVHDRMVLITSCSGGGYKFAPSTAKSVVSIISSIKATI